MSNQHPVKMRYWDTVNQAMHQVTVETNAQGNEVAKLGKPGEYTLMLFTGLHDSNGHEIYDSDILEYDSGFGSQLARVTVEWSNDDTGFIAGGYVLWKLVSQRSAVVIGNIYENPELLEEANGS